VTSRGGRFTWLSRLSEFIPVEAKSPLGSHLLEEFRWETVSLVKVSRLAAVYLGLPNVGKRLEDFFYSM